MDFYTNFTYKIQIEIVSSSSRIKFSFRKGSANPQDERYLYISGYALARYDASQSDINEVSAHEIQMEEIHDDEIMKKEKTLKNNDADIDMEISLNDDDELNEEDSMDVDEIQVNGNMYTFLTNEKR